MSVLVYERSETERAFRLISAFEVEHEGSPKERREVHVLYSGRCHYDALKV